MKSIPRYSLPVFVFSLGLLTCQPLQAENWPQWRGPFFNGSTSETHLPDHWSKTENVAWVTPMPGKSSATPAIWGDSVFVTSPDDQKNLLLLCLNAKDGQIRWQKTVGTGNKDVAKNNMCAPSPVTDGKLVVVMFGTGDLAAFDFDGKPLWSRNLAKEFGKFAIMFHYSSSPLLYHGKLYIQAIQRNPPEAYSHAVDDKPTRDSFLLCVDPQSGKDLWRQIRTTDASGESMDAYTSPTVYEGERGAEIILFGGGFVTAHNPGTGEEVWRCGSLNPNKSGFWRTVASPVTGPGFIYAAVPRHKSPLVAIKAGGSGLVPESQIIWKYTKNSTDVPSLLYYQEKLFVLDGNKRLMTCLDPKSGAEKWQDSLAVPELFSASPTAADGKIYCVSDTGVVVVLSAGDEFKILNSFGMEGEAAVAAVAKNGIPIPGATRNAGQILSSIAIANGHIFMRTPLNLYCIGSRP